MWVSDGSDEIVVEGSRVVCNVGPSSGSNVYNALWKEGGAEDKGILQGKAYWKIALQDLKEGNLFAGVSDLAKFKKGWSCKGLLYGGNLSNGGCLLVGNFGPWLKNNDVLGVFVDADESKIRVYFDVNGTSMGLAFDVPRQTLGNIYPMLHFSGSDFPSITRQEDKFEGLLGHWRYSSGSFEVTGGDEPTFEIRGSPTVYKGSLRVVNTIGVSITRNGPGEPFKGQPGASTMMGGPPELMRLESEMTKHVTGTFVLGESGQLVISDEDKTSNWTRFSPTKSPVTENPFQ
ncbi:Heterogeneous nuclear ribonucleoprotein U [Folsomia candida]|uniref:Heterogeneous nuclear ribonucleoprotein U n=1 Tax=Folsomia candida TaxID=158441 RepID=A0A226EWZ9_FOLCA|nr:Heterogeneous nuclear ribonucleoprotein U [Folsomia candida]